MTKTAMWAIMLGWVTLGAIVLFWPEIKELFRA
jgi:hypothetical protein